jgi:hypothetical protein
MELVRQNDPQALEMGQAADMETIAVGIAKPLLFIFLNH